MHNLPKPFVVLVWTAVAVGGATVIAVGQSDAGRHDSRMAPGGDFDGDGVPNGIDNCLVVPNPDQRDRDHDGIADACDADFNNDGVVDDQDRVALTRAFRTSARDKDLNGDGVVDEKDLQIFQQLLKAPSLRLDSDGDGVADLQDPCPTSSQSKLSSVPGCTMLDLLAKPDAVLGPLASIAGTLADDLSASSEMLDVRADLEVSIGDGATAERAIRRGDVCDASRPFGDADEHLGAALDSIDRQLTAARASVGAGPSPTAGGSRGITPIYLSDVSESDMLVAGLEYWHDRVDRLRRWGREHAAAFAAICGAAHPGTVRGAIQTIDNARRKIVLADGRLFGLADPITMTDDVYEGRAVEVGGLMFDDGNGQATTVKYDGAAPSVPPAAYVNCTDLRFTPVQRLPPVSQGPFVLHDPLGYKAVNDVYTVEVGMGVAAHAKCSPGKGGKSFPRYSLRVQISYQDKNGTAVKNAPMAPELRPGDEPVLFPSDVDPNAPATLHVRSEVRSCTFVQGGEECADPVKIIDTDYPLSVRARGTLAFAQYDQTEFDVNDQKTGDFRFAHVAFFTALAIPDPNTSFTFVAEGFGPFFDGISEMPIVNGDPFAIRNLDVFPIFPAVTPLGKLLEMGAAALAGVDHAAGLGWPRVEGIRNGRVFSYSAALPAGIVRDVVNFCETPNAYYRLPFAENFVFVQGQGNHPELPPATPGYTHSGGYAYDMIAPLDTPIIAARAGRVVKLTESNSVQCDPGDGCSPNNVFIQHQDGSIGEYVHMPQNSVLPEVGDLVRRGEQVAVVGVVGPSSGPHLHFATRTAPKPGGTTFLAKFEAFVLNFPQFALTACYVPQEGAVLGSNNVLFP